MNLTADEGKLFYDLYAVLLSFVTRKLKVSPEQFMSVKDQERWTRLAALGAKRDEMHHARVVAARSSRLAV